MGNSSYLNTTAIFKMPLLDISEIPQIVKDSRLTEISDENYANLLKNLKIMEQKLKEKMLDKFEELKEKLEGKYHFDLLHLLVTAKSCRRFSCVSNWVNPFLWSKINPAPVCNLSSPSTALDIIKSTRHLFNSGAMMTPLLDARNINHGSQACWS